MELHQITATMARRQMGVPPKAHCAGAGERDPRTARLAETVAAW